MLKPSPDYTEEELRVERATALLTYMKRAPLDEDAWLDRNINTVWNMMEPNAVPKIYISATFGVRTIEEVEQYIVIDDAQIKYLSKDYDGPKDGLMQYINERYMSFSNKINTNVLEPYIEKLGNCELVRLPGDHMIFSDRPEECGEIVSEFINALDG